MKTKDLPTVQEGAVAGGDDDYVSVDEDDEDDGDVDGGDDADGVVGTDRVVVGDIHQLKAFGHMFPEDAKRYRHTVRRNCKICKNNSVRTTYFCVQCSIFNVPGTDKRRLFWVCSPCSKGGSDCYAKHLAIHKIFNSK